MIDSYLAGPANPAEKLINVYFSLFRLLLEKKIGNGAIDKPEQEPNKKDKKAPRKFRHKGGKPKYASKAKPEAKPALPEVIFCLDGALRSQLRGSSGPE